MDCATGNSNSKLSRQRESQRNFWTTPKGSAIERLFKISQLDDDGGYSSLVVELISFN